MPPQRRRCIVTAKQKPVKKYVVKLSAEERDRLDAALSRKHSPASAKPRIFDGAAEAKLIAVTCSEPPKGRARWTLNLLETAVVELNIVDRASDNTIGRTLKKTRSSLTCKSNGSSRRRPTPPS